jgi:hypothetical protein
MSSNDAKSPFSGTQNKLLITKYWDYPILKDFSESIGKPLDYFGLSGPKLEDVRSWRDVLHRIRSVERHRKGENEEIDRQNQRDAVSCAFINKLNNVSIVQGDVEDVILTGVDSNGRIIPGSFIDEDGNIFFEHSLVNLDFFGGIGYLKENQITRVDAIRKLFERQRGQNFVFILNVNVRDGVSEKINEFLNEYSDQSSDTWLKETIKWYLGQNLGKNYKLKAVIPLLIKNIAENNHFKTTFFPPISYLGGGNALMAHFVFLCEYESGKLQMFSAQTPRQILNLPLIEVSNGRFAVPDQHPECDLSGFASQNSFIADLIKNGLLEQFSDLAKTDNVEY